MTKMALHILIDYIDTSLRHAGSAGLTQAQLYQLVIPRTGHSQYLQSRIVLRMLQAGAWGCTGGRLVSGRA